MLAAERVGAHQIRLLELSVFTMPPRLSAMAVAKGYADDSEDGRVWVVGGYAGHPLQWEQYEAMWPMALANREVPYFHMREMASPTGVYKKWVPPQEHQEELADFFRGLTDVVSHCHLRGFFSIVRKEDLKRFNSEFGVRLEPYPLAAYGCALMLADIYDSQPVEIVFDHADKISSKLAKASRYGDGDTRHGRSLKNVILTPLSENFTFKQIIPLQVADFFSWEIRKHHLKADDWFSLPDKPTGEEERWRHFQTFHLNKEGAEYPTPRKTLQALAKRAPEPNGIIWDYDNLCQAHRARAGVWS
jgi:hypothetical protein